MSETKNATIDDIIDAIYNSSSTSSIYFGNNRFR